MDICCCCAKEPGVFWVSSLIMKMVIFFLIFYSFIYLPSTSSWNRISCLSFLKNSKTRLKYLQSYLLFVISSKNLFILKFKPKLRTITCHMKIVFFLIFDHWFKQIFIFCGCCCYVSRMKNKFHDLIFFKYLKFLKFKKNFSSQSK